MAEKEKKRVLPLSASRVLIILSVVLLVVAAFNVDRYSGSAYFAWKHQPLNLDFWSSKPTYSRTLPVFTATDTLSQGSLTTGGVQRITITATSNTTVRAYIEAWLSNPNYNEKGVYGGNQVWQSPTAKTVLFPKNTPVTITYTYTIPATIPRGTYEASLILNSSDTNTDYLVKENIARFIVT